MDKIIMVNVHTIFFNIYIAFILLHNYANLLLHTSMLNYCAYKKCKQNKMLIVTYEFDTSAVRYSSIKFHVLKFYSSNSAAKKIYIY